MFVKDETINEVFSFNVRKTKILKNVLSSIIVHYEVGSVMMVLTLVMFFTLAILYGIVGDGGVSIFYFLVINDDCD
jgi:hypothetical protein